MHQGQGPGSQEVQSRDVVQGRGHAVGSFQSSILSVFERGMGLLRREEGRKAGYEGDGAGCTGGASPYPGAWAAGRGVGGGAVGEGLAGVRTAGDASGGSEDNENNDESLRGDGACDSEVIKAAYFESSEAGNNWSGRIGRKRPMQRPVRIVYNKGWQGKRVTGIERRGRMWTKDWNSKRKEI